MGERCISISNLIRTNCFTEVLQRFFVICGRGRKQPEAPNLPLALLRSGNDTIHIGAGLERDGWKSLLPWVVCVERSKREHLHNPTNTTNASAHHHNSYRGPGWRRPCKKVRHYRHSVSSNGLFVSQAILQPQGVAVTHQAELYPTANPFRSCVGHQLSLDDMELDGIRCTEQTVGICPGKRRRRWFRVLKRKVRVISHLPRAQISLCARMDADLGCGEVLLLQLHPTPPVSAHCRDQSLLAATTTAELQTLPHGSDH